MSTTGLPSMPARTLLAVGWYRRSGNDAEEEIGHFGGHAFSVGVGACRRQRLFRQRLTASLSGLGVQAVERHGDDVVGQLFRRKRAARLVPLHDRVDGAEQQPGHGAGVDVLAQRSLVAGRGDQPATLWSKARRRSMAFRSMSVLPRSRSSSVTKGRRSTRTAMVWRSTNSRRASAAPEVAPRLRPGWPPGRRGRGPGRASADRPWTARGGRLRTWRCPGFRRGCPWTWHRSRGG